MWKSKIQIIFDLFTHKKLYFELKSINLTFFFLFTCSVYILNIFKILTRKKLEQLLKKMF